MSDANQIAAGAARVRLDPPLGIAMMGYGGRTGRSSGIHDDLCAQAIVIADGKRKLAIASVDVLALGVRICDAIAVDVAARSDLAADAIMICATHTHSAPMFNIFATPRADAANRADRSIEWERALPGKVAEAILEANRRLEQVRIRAAAARFTLGTNRRLKRANGTVQLAANYGGPADPEAVALGFFRSNGDALAIVSNYPCHGVVLCEDNLLYSRDWPGFATDGIERGLANRAGATPIALFLQGATGNIDPRSRGSFEVAAHEGSEVAHGLVEALKRADWLALAPLAIRRIPLSLPIKDLGGVLAVAKACVAQTDLSLRAHRAGDGYQLKRLQDHHAQANDALRALEAVEEMNRRDRRVDAVRGTMQTHMTVAAVGTAAIVGVPGEVFVELGLALKQNRFFAPTIVAGYCNDLVGYIPTRTAYTEGGYEVDTARVAEGSGEMLLARALDDLGAIATEASARH